MNKNYHKYKYKIECKHCSKLMYFDATEEEFDGGFNLICADCGEKTHIARRTCLYCLEKIKPGAIKCKHCGETLINLDVKNENPKISWSNKIIELIGVFGIFLFIGAIIGGSIFGFLSPNECIKSKPISFSDKFFSISCKIGSTIKINLFSSNNQQITDTDDIIKTIEKSIVYVKYEYTGLNENYEVISGKSSGSGIIKYGDDSIIEIYTNKHVVDCLYTNDCISKINEKVTVRTNGGTIYEVKQVSFAPNNIDLALLDLNKKSNDFEISKQYVDYTPKIGEKVIAIGYPAFTGGVLEFSRARGEIISYRDFLMSNGFAFKGVESDAFASFGSSGGGLFSNDGALIGIVTWKDEQSENLIAIDTQTIKNFGNTFKYCENGSYILDGYCVPYCSSNEILADDYKCHKNCNDGTLYGDCSRLNIGGACVDGELIPNCGECGCPADYPLCKSNGECFRCPDGSYLGVDGNCYYP